MASWTVIREVLTVAAPITSALAGLGVLVIQILNWRIQRAAEERKRELDKLQKQVFQQQIEANRLSLQKISSPLIETAIDINKLLLNSRSRPNDPPPYLTGLPPNMPFILVLLIAVILLDKQEAFLKQLSDFVFVVLVLCLALLVKNVAGWVASETYRRFSQLKQLRKPIVKSEVVSLE